MNAKNSLLHYTVDVMQTQPINKDYGCHTIALTLNLSDGTGTGNEIKVPVTMNELQAQRVCNYLINAINEIAYQRRLRKQKIKPVAMFN